VINQTARIDRAIEAILRLHQGRENPIRIEDMAKMERISHRSVWASIERLRTDHRLPIGSRRDSPGGYFWIRDDEDLDVTLGFYRKQIATMQNNIAILQAACGEVAA